MFETRDTAAYVSDALVVDIAYRRARSIGALRNDGAPGIDDHAVTERGSRSRVNTPLTCRKQPTLIFDGARSEQRAPVVLTSLLGERGGHNQDVRSASPQLGIQQRKPQIVTDRKPHLEALDVDDRERLPRSG